MSIEEAALLLGIAVEDALTMIDAGTLCASVDDSTGEWLVKTACVRAQLAETVPLATGNGGDEAAGDQVIKISSGRKVAAFHFEETDLELDNHTHGSSTLDRQECEEIVAEMLEHIFQQEVETPPAALPVQTPAPMPEVVSTPPAPVAPEPEQQKSFDRAEITARNVQALLDSLDFANVRLEGSMYRVGYLEAQVSSLEEQLELMNEYRNRAAKSILIDRENDLLKEKVAGLETQNSDMQEHLTALDEHLVQAHMAISRIEKTWWYRLFSWLFQFKPFERLN